MDNSEEYYKMKYFKYKAKYQQELARQRGGSEQSGYVQGGEQGGKQSGEQSGVQSGEQGGKQSGEQGEPKQSIFSGISKGVSNLYKSAQKSVKASNEKDRNELATKKQKLVDLVRKYVVREKSCDQKFAVPNFNQNQNFEELEQFIKELKLTDAERININNLYKACQGDKKTIACTF